MLRVERLQVALRRLPILRGVSLAVAPGAIVALVGRNGAGKTTTLRAVMGLVPVSGGEVALDGTDLRQTPAHRRVAHGIGYQPEDRRLIPILSVEENLMVPVWANGWADGRARLERTYSLLPGLAAFARRRAGQLSGGQQKMVALGRAMMVGRRLLLLDEPFEGLAPALVEGIADALVRAAADGAGVLIAESELTHVGGLAHRTYTIERGEIVEARDAGRA